MSDSLLQEALSLFQSSFHASPTVAASAPGRVNLIGEHTDYNDGFVLPFALQLRTVVVARTKPLDQPFRLVSSSGEMTIIPESRVQELQNEYPHQPAGLDEHRDSWTRYPAGVIALFRRRGFSVPPLDVAVVSDVPLGAGLSSSAALEVATATLCQAVTGARLSETEVALLCQQAEHEFAGVPCGIMDQSVSAMAKVGKALLLDCRTLEPRFVPFAGDRAVVLVVNTNVKHSLSDGEYAVRRGQCEEAVRILKDAGKPEISHLRDCVLADLGPLEQNVVVFRRAKHVVSENQRCLEFADLLEAGNLEHAGKLMVQSHRSLQFDYEVSCEELDFVVDTALGLQGVFGARMTGGGFGGSCVVLIEKHRAEEIQEAILNAYASKFSRQASALITSPSAGAQILSI